MQSDLGASTAGPRSSSLASVRAEQANIPNVKLEMPPTKPFSAGLDDVVIHSQGSKLLGGFYRGAGVGPRPTAILLHGVPGVEKNLDIAYALRDAGWNCLYFHYRGSWGSEGDYTFAGALDDVAAATEWVLAQPSVNPKRLALIGNSFGGYLALAVAAADDRFRATVSICPLIDPALDPLPAELFDEFAQMLHGVTGPELFDQWNALPSILTRNSELVNRRLLLVTGDRDELFPVSHYERLAAKLESLWWERVADADHALSGYRNELVVLTVDWLRRVVGS